MGYLSAPGARVTTVMGRRWTFVLGPRRDRARGAGAYSRRVSERSVLQVLQPQDGGVADHALRLSRGLVERGWAVEAAVSPGSTIAEPLAVAGVTVRELDFAREPGVGDLGAARRLRAIDARGGRRIVHAHSSKAGALARVALPESRRIAYTPHCFAFAAGFSAARRLAYRAIEQALVPRTGAIVAVCDWERRLAEKELVGAGRRTRVILNGVEPAGPEPPAPELVEFAGGLPLAGLVSVLRPQKDPLLFVRAAASLPSSAGRVAIVGNGELAEDVRREIDRLGAADRVRWFEFRGGVGRYLAALDVFALSSAWEAFPLSVLEAMSCGLPVVATDVGGVGEAVSDGVSGRLVAPGGTEAFAAALEELLGDASLRATMGERGRTDYESRYRVDPMIDAVAALYEELMERTR